MNHHTGSQGSAGDAPDEESGIGFGTVDQALTALRRGDLVVVADDQARENEGDLIGAAEMIDAARMSFMIRHTSGIVCVAITDARAQALQLPPMIGTNSDPHRTAFTVAVDAATGVSTGIGAHDRARTVRLLADPTTQPDQLSRPGHVFPLVARPHGVLERSGHTEAGVDLMRLAGLRPAAVLSEIMCDNGEPARRTDLLAFAARHGLVAITVAQLQKHRLRTENLAVPGASCSLPTRHGLFTARSFTSTVDGTEHLALTRGSWQPGDEVLVRVHSECLTGDTVGSVRCDCGDQFHESLRRIATTGRGVIVYLRRHEGRGIGLAAKIAAYALQDDGMDTVDANFALGLPADARRFDMATHILRHLGVEHVALLTNNTDKLECLRAGGLRVRRERLTTAPRRETAHYLRTKRDRLGHLLADTDIDPGAEIHSGQTAEPAARLDTVA